MSRTFSVVPVGLFSFDFDVREGEAAVGSIVNRAGFLQIKGTLTVSGKQFFTRREGAFRNSYLLEAPAGTIEARADRRVALSEEYDVSFADRTVRLKKKLVSARGSFTISESSDELGSIVQESLMSRRLRCELETGAGELPREIVMFLIWMVLIIGERDSSAD